MDDQVYEIWDRLSRQRANERIYENANDALKTLESLNVDPRHYRVQGITFQRAEREPGVVTYTPCRFEVIPGVGEDGRCIANATVDGYCKPHAGAVRAALQGDQ